ncbi:MAG: HAMP domain-containing protein, partial [Opitutae bacterium]|nr:HAMP domain-containing protein [Opitutae bacterium]
MTADPPPPRRAPRQQQWSITGRLTLLYIGSTAVLLLLAAGYLYWGLQQSLTREDRALVAGKLRVMQGLLREQHGQPGVLENEIEHEASANELLKYYMRVLDSRGHVLIETTDMSGLIPVPAFPAPAWPSAGAPAIIERTLGPGRTYLLLAAEVEAGAAGKDRRILQIALDVGHNHDVLADYRWELLVVLGSGLVFAALAGMAVTRTGLRPVREIARATHRITASSLAERLDPAQWPVELRELAAACDAMRVRLQDSFGRLTEFSADIAHALRNPINNLRGEAEVALVQGCPPEEYRQILGSSLEEYERLSRMIDGLLFIARTDDPNASIEHSAIVARRELEAVQEFYEALADEKNITVV